MRDVYRKDLGGENFVGKCQGKKTFLTKERERPKLVSFD